LKTTLGWKLAAGLGACAAVFVAAAAYGPDLARSATAAAKGAAGAAPAVGAGKDWPAHNGDAYETAYSRLDQITAANVGRLGLAFSLDLPGEISLHATPLAVNGVLYFTGSQAAVYAVDGATGKVLWKHDPESWKYSALKMRFGMGVNRGAAYGDGRIYSAAKDGRLFALDAKTGKVIWVTQTLPPDNPENITGAPRFFNGKVIIGSAGADFGVRGRVTAFDAATGKELWRFYTAPGSPEQNKGDPAMEMAAATWHGEYWKTGTGGGVWDSITFDPDLNRLYLATGNAAPYDPDLRSPGGGDNLFTASIVAIDADTGKYVWHYQVNPRDSWDYDSNQQMTLAELTVDGKPRKVLMQAPKNGFFYILDRESGKLISAEKYGKVTWADHIDLKSGRPVEAPNIRYETGDVVMWPAPLGAHSWQSMAYSPRTGLVYVPYMQLGVHFKRGEEPGFLTLGGIAVMAHKADPMDDKGAVLAWDPVHQKEAWKAPLDTIWNGGMMATAGDLVFAGAGDGYVSAYDARSGKRLWRFYAGMGINAAPSTYSIGGKQYVALLAGYGGSASSWGKPLDAGWSVKGPRRLLVFALDGKAKLPASRARFTALKPLDDPSLTLDPKQVAAGEQQYLRCSVCHGLQLNGTGGPAPDLRESPIAFNRDSLWSVVHDGTLMSQGMPSYPDLTREQSDQIFAYIRDGARKLIAQQKAAPAKP
jgi:quinohemoprotein ethanol dehydrogenase